MSHNKQKCKEKFHFMLFKERYEEWRDGEERHENGEGKPDFLITYPDKILGIELTEPFKLKGEGQAISPQQREGSLQDIVSQARLFYEEHNNHPLKVDVWFSPTFKNTQITKSKIKELGQKLAELVRKELPENILFSPLSLDIIPKNKLPEIARILISSAVVGYWKKVGASWAKRNFIDELQECIDKKNGIYDRYIIKCDECWLLMVADGSNTAQCFVDDNNGEVFNHTYQSKFSKTFYLEVTARPVKLKTTWQ